MQPDTDTQSPTHLQHQGSHGKSDRMMWVRSPMATLPEPLSAPELIVHSRPDSARRGLGDPTGPCTERLRFPGPDESVESVPVGSLHRSYHPLGSVDHKSNELGCDLLGIQEHRRV